MNSIRTCFIIGLFILGAAGYFWYNSARSTRDIPAVTQETKLKVATSFYPLYFLTSEIAKDNAVVYNITPAGAEPHDYEPTTQDVARIEDSNLLVINGGNFEPWVDDLEQALKNTDNSILDAGESLIHQTVVEEGEKIRDPHVWLNPLLAKKQAEMIAQSLVKLDPTNADAYENNTRELIDKLEILDAEFRKGLSMCQKKDIITSHSAFGYLAAAYGLNQVSVTGVTPDEDPSAKQLAEVAEFAKKNKVTYIFFESLVSPKFSETIAKEIGAKTLVLNPLEGLAGEEIAEGKNYFTEMKSNLVNLKIALECR